MKIRESNRHEEEIELQMAPMIDIVFQLLVFFIMTFKIVAMEGDFNIKMPKGAAPSDNMDFDPPLTIELQADSTGKISNIIIKYPTEDVSLGKDFSKLTQEIVALVGTGPERQANADATEIIFDCDEFLEYGEYINALTSVTGYINESDELVRLVENVKLRDQAK